MEIIAVQSSYLITLGTCKDDTVFDPYMGSGTTGIACVDMEREFVGIEKVKEFFEIADTRIKNRRREYEKRLF